MGVRFGKITVTEVLGGAKTVGVKGRGLIVRGACDCGGCWTGTVSSLRRGNTKSCGCLATGPIPDPNREKSAAHYILYSYKRHAARRGLEWRLSDQEFRTLLKGVCYYCGAPPTARYKDRKREGGRRRRTIISMEANGIDRKDNSQGYTTENSVSCCSICNYSKRALDSTAFLEHVQRIYARHFGGP